MNAKDVTIHEPCHEDWEAMNGRGKQRFCGSCTKHVHDFSQMTRVEAEQMLKTESSPCVRYSCGPSGDILFRKSAPLSTTEPKRVPPSRRRRSKRALLLGAAMMVASPAMASAVPAEDPGPSLIEALMETVRDWWVGEPEGCAGPGLVDPIPETDTTFAERPMMGMMVMVEPEEIPELTTVKGEVALPPPALEPKPIHPRPRMGKIARKIDPRPD